MGERTARPVCYKNRRYESDGVPAFLYSGEVHYFRLDPDQWRDRIRKLADVGANCLSTYIPWLYHEPEEGRILFGTGRRNLKAFLDICAEEDISVLVRPGPYIYSETRNMGLPLWLVQRYPSILAQKADGSAMSPHSVSYLHPVFLEKVRRWYGAVCPIIAGYCRDKGGPVALMQLDNELMGVHEWFGGMDYNSRAMGIGEPSGIYVQWLMDRYVSINDLNDAYDSKYESFEAVRPQERGVSGHVLLNRQIDYRDFYNWASAKYLKILADMARQEGVTVPFTHNSPGPTMNPQFFETMESLGHDEFLLGTDHYYTLTMKFPQNAPTMQWFIRCFISLEMMRLTGYPPTLFEMHGGSASDFPLITYQDTKCAAFGNIALGAVGVNSYMFAGGSNPEGIGETGELYDYQSAVGPQGDLRPNYKAHMELGEFLNANPDLASMARVSDFGIGLIWDYCRGKDLPGQGALQMGMNDAWNLAVDGIALTSVFAGYSSELVDLRTGLDDYLQTGKPLWVATSTSLDRRIQQKLVDFAEAGGRLIIGPVIPTLDRDMGECGIIADALGCSPSTALHGGTAALEVMGIRQVWVNKRLFTFDGLGGHVQVVATEGITGKAGGFRVSVGKGDITVFGLDWYHSKVEHAEMLSRLLEGAGAERTVVSNNRNLLYALRRSPSSPDGYLFAINPWSSHQHSEVLLPEGVMGEKEISLVFDVPAMDVAVARMK